MQQKMDDEAKRFTITNIETDDKNNDFDREKVLFPARYFMATMGCTGLAIVYGFQVNVSVAIVAMVNYTAIKPNASNRVHEETSSVCDPGPVLGANASTISNTRDGPFTWDESMQGLILSAYFWGYMLTQVLGGRISELFSASWVMNGCVIINAVACILTPLAAQLHYALFIALRFTQGLGGGVSFPAMHVMIAKWSPPADRNMLSSIIYAGCALGTVIYMSVSGLLATKLGWAAVFYVEGSLSLIWCVAWRCFIRDSPEQQTILITRYEKNYITRSLGRVERATDQKKLPVPWGHVLRSLPFWAIVISHFCNNFGWYMLLAELPTYMSQILKFDHNQSAVLSALPYLGLWIFSMSLGKVLSYMVSKRCITITVSRKIGESFTTVVPMCCLIAVSYVGCNTDLAVFLVTAGITCIGGAVNGSLTNHIDIAPNFAGTLMAMTNTIATIPGFVVPILVGELTNGNQTVEAWRIVFLITAGLYLIEIVVFIVFGTAEEQVWNRVRNSDVEVVAISNTNANDHHSIVHDDKK